MTPHLLFSAQPDAIEVSAEALHGNEVHIVVLSYRNPSVRSKSFMLKSRTLLITTFTIPSDSTAVKQLE